MFILSNVLLMTVYVVSMIALFYSMYLLNKDSKALQEVYKDFLDKDGQR